MKLWSSKADSSLGERLVLSKFKEKEIKRKILTFFFPHLIAHKKIEKKKLNLWDVLFLFFKIIFLVNNIYKTQFSVTSRKEWERKS